MTKSDVFALAGICLLSIFAFQIWAPLSLGVFGIACLRASYATAPSITAEGEDE